MKKLLDQVPQSIDEIYEQFGVKSQRAANALRWFFVAMFLVATLWSLSDDSAAKFIYPILALLWLIAALTMGLGTNATTHSSLAMWLDLIIISTGLLLCAWQGVFNTKGWIVFICYFPVLAVLARRQNTWLVLQAAAFIAVVYGLLSLFALGSLALPRLLAIAAMAIATYTLTRKPKDELVTATQNAIREAYNSGLTDKETEMVAFVHAQSFPPAQYNLPGLYAAYKHGVGTTTSGDFYAAFETASGPTVVLGDLPGNGLDAAMAATQLQRQITQIACERATLSEVATELNAMMHHKNQTVSCVLARWEGSYLHYLNAGHLPAVHISKREAKLLPVNAPPLGTAENAAYAEEIMEFPKGDLLLLYTDGAYAGLAQTPQDGAAEILRLADQFSGGEVNTICHRVFDCGLPEYAKPQDDSTVVIVRRQEFASEATG